ncbi:hypothetical protein MTHERMMSTA1_24390 [Methanosarcina thermophila MST-A1]|jgi:tetratricopeptide (TPR) repeat protein|nr:tetratricopeptide repeat protein [Methanosarcina thermophila]AKB12527.1 TPR Domain containing protein [Methanosarcina thermophila TM-1]AKB16819.1 TPR Domain containing protein [Methanosarcina thermophila CHTI-55]BAW30240.1 TPR repeat-containing protein [Methanosarcina thermophila]GLI15313.1 hypothetical protein MTHERMMSTA1_24390 [Methanosarcina thermophila MST-A1]HOQ66783.1 tetratricopeptide repeat protein [Methanosarcina thermophila]
MYTPGKIKDEIEKVEGNTINVIILDSPPITDDKDAVQKGKKTGAHLVIYGGDHRVVTGETITEFYIISTNTSSTTPLFLDVNSSKKAIPILYSDKSIRLESVKQNVSSAVYTALAFEYYRKSQYASAIKMFKHIVNYENEKTILFYIGNCYCELSNFDGSVPNKFLINESLLNESLVYYYKTIEIDCNYSLAWNNIGYVLEELGNHDEALKAYDKAIQLDPNNSIAWDNKGCTLDSLSRYDEAINAFDKAIQLDPSNSFAWNNKGSALYSLGKYDEAIDAYDKAIQLDPNNSIAWYKRACVFSLINDKEQAMSDLKYAIELNSSYKEISRNDSYFEKLWTDEEFKKLVNNTK